MAAYKGPEAPERCAKASEPGKVLFAAMRVFPRRLSAASALAAPLALAGLTIAAAPLASVQSGNLAALSNGTGVNETNEDKKTPLMLAVNEHFNDDKTFADIFNVSLVNTNQN